MIQWRECTICNVTTSHTCSVHNTPCLNKQEPELMLTRRAKAYSSSCSQTASLSPAISPQFILVVCAAAEDRKSQ